jgi:hypothetical protein
MWHDVNTKMIIIHGLALCKRSTKKTVYMQRKQQWRLDLELFERKVIN